MAVNYANLFADVGKLIKAVDQIRGSASDAVGAQPAMGTLLGEIRTQLNASSVFHLVDGLTSDFDAYRDNLVSIADSIANRATNRLIDRTTVANELLASPIQLDSTTIIPELAKQMIADSETIDNSAVVIGAPTAITGNVGNGTIYTTGTLDGISEPSPGFPPQTFYRGKLTELAVPSELMSISCIQDSDTDLLSEGQETFRIEGQPGPVSGSFDWRSEGSGVSLTLSTLNTFDVIANRDFENADVNNFTNWDVESGAEGTEILQETVSAEVFRGKSALALVGTGTDATLRQTIPVELLQPNGLYLFTVAVKGDAAADGSLDIAFVSDSGEYTASGTEKISLDSTALQGLSGGYALQSFYWMIPASIPDDLKLEIKYSGGTAGTIRVDSITFGRMTYANGVGFAIVAGATPFVRGDRFSVQVDNAEGVFQRFFRRQYHLQMPSSNSPTRADALAQ